MTAGREIERESGRVEEMVGRWDGERRKFVK